MKLPTQTILILFIAIFATFGQGMAKIHNFHQLSENLYADPGENSLYKDIQAHRLHTIFLDTEISKIFSGQLPDISISEINRRVGMLEARMNFFQKVTTNMEIRSNAKYSLPQNLTIQEITYQFGSELSFLQATLLGGKSMSGKKFEKHKAENEAKISVINDEIRDYTRTYGYDIIIIDPTIMPAGPEEMTIEEENQIAWIEEATSMKKPPVSSVPQNLNQEEIKEKSIDNPVETEIAIKEPSLPSGPPPTMAQLEGINTKPNVVEDPVVLLEVHEKAEEPVLIEKQIIIEEPVIEIEAPAVIEKPIIIEDPVVEAVEPVVVKRPVAIEELASIKEPIIVEEMAHNIEPEMMEKSVVEPEQLEKIEKVAGEYIYYQNEVARLNSELENIKKVRFSSQRTKTLSLNPIKEKLTLIGKQIAGRDENSKTTELINTIFVDIMTTQNEIAKFESKALPLEQTAKKELPKSMKTQRIRYVVQGTEKWHFFYDPGQTQLRNYQVTNVMEIMNILEATPEAAIVITGFTDKSGQPEKNISLSKQRAETVKSLFTEKGIDSNRVRIAFVGDKGSIRSNDPFNRRVEIKMVLNQ